MTDFLLTLLIGTAVGYVLFKMKVPGGMMVGGVVGVAFFNILCGRACMPLPFKVMAQIIAGSFIGSTVNREDLKRLPHIAGPMVTVTLALLSLNIVYGFVVWKVTSLDLTTALMSAIPGGMSDVPLIAADLGADGPKVAVLQFIRLIAGIGLFPSMIHWVAVLTGQDEQEDTSQMKARMKKKEGFWQTVAIAAPCGVLGQLSGMPAGTLVFSMAGIMVWKLTGHSAHMPTGFKRLAQVLSGAYIGAGIDLQDVLEMKQVIVPAILLIVGYFAVCYVTGQFLHRHFGMTLKEAMLAATPAGASDMALIASDLGVNSTDLIIMQVLRLVIVIAIFPSVMIGIIHLFS